MSFLRRRELSKDYSHSGLDPESHEIFKQVQDDSYISLNFRRSLNDIKHEKLPIIFFSLSFISTLLAFLLLVYGFIISDFSIQNVFLNSSTLKPLMFKIAASWASHEGSILLWLCLLQSVGFSYVFLLNYYQLNQDCKIAIIITSSIYILFSIFIYFTSNPFIGLSFKPAQGLGLNPMLQDIALIIHPPILYLGYVSYLAPFTIACTILLKSKIEYTDLKIIKLFANVGILFLTSGIALGSWWAYRELGWGGFWFFDPVENISLLPWLTGIILYHSIIITIKYQKMQSWVIYISIITFLTAIFSTFLVRSGLITSIHSFALSQERAIYMLVIFTIIAIPTLILMVMKSKMLDISMVTNDLIPSSQSKFVIIGGWCFLISFMVLLYATSYPIIYDILYQESITIKEKFFINNFVIFLIPTILLAGLSKAIKKNIAILIISLIITVISSTKILYGFISAIVTMFSVFLIMQNCYSFLKKSGKKLNIAKILGHLGFGLLALSIVLNSVLQSEIDFIGKIGDKTETENFIVTLKDIRVSAAQNYYRQIAEFWIEDKKKNNLTILTPENRLYIIEQQLSQESNIYSYLTYDLYAVLNQIDGKTIHAKIYYKPMMSLIWISIMLIAGGFLIGIFNGKEEKEVVYI
ncbi:MAG: heme lyase CcmF/NrfE family subunit [Rickettsia endosymbiont of Bryobia graminum]|nr:heme lyase CcmF/NrfE family subunit [Rickettsia endosymbiont of Bryobia graminum]